MIEAEVDISIKHCQILTLPVQVTNITQVSAQLLQIATQRQTAMVCLANVHMLMEAQDDADFLALLRAADYLLPDGRPLFWLQRIAGFSQATQVRGYDLMLALCQQAAAKGIKVGCYGGTDSAVLADLKRDLLHRFPTLKLDYTYAPPFRDLTIIEDQQQMQQIQASGVQLLFVALGCPKQEKWMAAHRHQLPVVMLGVGAAFDFLSGRKPHAPAWLQRLGLEWLFRWCNEPLRLSWRYLKHNPRFILYFGWQWFCSMMSRNKPNGSRQ